MHKTPTYELLEQKLGQELSTYVVEQRAAGASWAAIARRLYDSTRMVVTPETLRIWFAEQVSA